MLFRNNLGNLKEFFGQMFHRPPWQKMPVRLCEHQALRQHNSKKNSRNYVKVSKIELLTFLKLGFLISCGEICVTIDCPRLHHGKLKWPYGVIGSLRLIYIPILKGILIVCCRYNHSYLCKHMKQLYFILGKK